MALRIVTPALAGLVALEAGKAQLRIDHDDEDTEIEALIAVATAHVEAITQRRYVTQTLEWVLTAWPCEALVLPIAPVAGVTSITVTLPGQQPEVWPADQYVAFPKGQGLAIRPRRGVIWPVLDCDAAEPIVIRFVAGDEAENVPAAARQAALLLISHFYENRSAVEVGQTLALAELPMGVASLLLAETWS